MQKPPQDFCLLPEAHVVFVDDSHAVFADFREPLLLATKGEATFIVHAEQPLEKLAEEILVQPFSLLLLDGQLGNGVRGWEVLKMLRELRDDVRCIGFSSDPAYADFFLQAGAIGFVEKRCDDPWGSIAKIRSITRGDDRSSGM